jgi:undecaprenyl-diphosphatase
MFKDRLTRSRPGDIQVSVCLEAEDEFVTRSWPQEGGSVAVARDPSGMTRQLLLQLGAQDRALLLRCALRHDAAGGLRLFWLGITHLGGTGPLILAAGLPWFACCQLHEASELALLALVLSHLVVQVIKRTVSRARPSTVDRLVRLVTEPDRFSFPSGHATASMSVALAYGAAFPNWSVPLLVMALLVGFSRVRLRVHYPSDVLVGQLIAIITLVVLSSFMR